jgi:hypothetical protein
MLVWISQSRTKFLTAAGVLKVGFVKTAESTRGISWRKRHLHDFAQVDRRIEENGAAKHHKPWIHLHPGGYEEPERLLLQFLMDHNIETLNVAGTRASKEPDVYRFVKQTLENALFPRPRTGWLGGPGEG